MTKGRRGGHGRVRLLGPVELAGPDQTVALPDGPRSLLAALALRVGEAVGRGQLRDAGCDPSTLDRDAAALATALARCGLRGALEKRATGYRLASRHVDVQRFREALRRARACRSAGDLRAAVSHLDQALALWRSEDPLAGVALAGWAAAEVGRLRESRTCAMEDRWDCLLRLAAAAVRDSGAPVADRAAVTSGISAIQTAAAAAAELEAAVTLHPLRERLWELLLTATFLGGHPRAAATVYERARRTFLDHLGVEPGRGLRGLAAAAKRGDLVETVAGEAEPVAAERNDPPPRQIVRGAALPVPLTSLLGRDALLMEIAERLGRHRLVTLIGPGGAGKTRLAIAAARRAVAAAEQEAQAVAAAEQEVTATGPATCFVDLSAVESPVRVPTAVAEALGLRDEPGRDTVDALVDDLADHEVLLVLDNCEHLIAGCAELAHRLLDRCPRLRVLATSRAALRVPGESLVPVPPLPSPVPKLGHTLAELGRHAATQLFLERAQARSGRPVPEGWADAVAQLCAELDGLPLAIELAAARTTLLSVPEIVDKLRTDLRLLHSPDRTVPARHRTVAAAVESSLRQLDPDVRAFFDRLAVFAGGFDAAAAEAVRGSADLPALATLVNASIVEGCQASAAGSGGQASAAGSGGQASAALSGDQRRYRMLMPIRRHALARLAASGAEQAARRAHASHYLAVAESADAQLRGSAQERGLGRLRTEAANLRAAMSWLAEAGAAAVPYGDMRLAIALAMYCRIDGHYREARGWLAAALARHPRAPAALRGAAGADTAMLAMLLCDYPAAASYAEEARAAYRAVGDRRAEARVEMILGSVARERGQYAASARHLDAAAATYVECGDELGEARAVQLRGFTAWLAGDLDRAEPRLRACRRWFDRLGDPEAAASALMNLGAVALYRGDTDRAASLLDAALERYAALGFPEGVGWAHNLRGLVELRAGRNDRAEAHLALSLATHRQVGDRWRTASVLEALAEVRRAGDPRQAARLLGAAARIREEIGAPVPACERADVDTTAAAVRAAMGEAAFRAAYAQATTHASTPSEVGVTR